MIGNGSPPSSRAEALRRAFDASFSYPPRNHPSDESWIAVRVAGDPYAIRVTDLAGVVRRPHITRLPSGMTEVLGLTSVGGMLIPVYRLATLLGYPADASEPRWLLLHGARETVGLAFEALEGHVTVARSEHRRDESGQSHVTGVVQFGNDRHAMIDLDSLTQAVRRRVLGDAPIKE